MNNVEDMMDFITQNWSDLLTLFIAVSALIASMLAWYKSRVIYGIERKLYFRRPDKKGPNNNESLRKMLSSGKYTILHVQDYGGYPEILLGKVKKK
jgi:hypothetical protein